MAGSRILSSLFAAAVAVGVVGSPLPFDEGMAAAAKSKKKKKSKAKPKAAAAAPAKAEVVLSGDQKAARAELLGVFTWGMSKVEVIAALSKQLDERYAVLIADTNDVYQQDKLRKEKSAEVKRVKKSFVSFDGKNSSWDASIVDGQFRHGTDEAMLTYWELANGRNQRRFFFFHDGALYKMFIQVDTTQFGEDQRTFEFFSGFVSDRYGADVVDPQQSYRTYTLDAPFVQALDRTRMFDAFCIVVLDPGRAKAVDAVRAERIKPVDEESKILKAVEDDGSTPPDLNGNKDVIQGIIKGGGK